MTEEEIRKRFGLDDPEDMAQGGRAGFFLGSANPRGLGLLRQILKYMSKTGQELDKFQGCRFLSIRDVEIFKSKKAAQIIRGWTG